MVAILMATYNGERFIDSAIQSIIDQTFQDFMIYIHDDGSTDNTMQIIEKNIELHSDKIRVIEHDSMGSACKNFLFLLESVNAEWYMFADQDDVWDKRKLETLMQCAQQFDMDQKIPILLFSDLEVVDSNLHPVADSFFSYNNIDPQKTELRQIITQNVVPGCTSFFNSSLRKEALKFNDIEHIRFHDWWLACVAAATGKIFFVDDRLVKYRQHADNLVGAEKDDFVKNLERVIKIFTGRQIEGSHRRIVLFVRQACQLEGVCFVDEKNREMITSLQGYFSLPKLQRMLLFKKYGITRSKRNIWMYLTL